jgi:hypothetical protein
MAFELDGEQIMIVGYVDAFDRDTAIIYDLKTIRFVEWQAEKGFIPRENRAAQVQCYYTLLDNCGIQVQVARSSQSTAYYDWTILNQWEHIR